MSSPTRQELNSFQKDLNQVVPSGPKQMQKLSYLKRMLEAALIDLDTLKTMPEKQANILPRVESALGILRTRIPELLASQAPPAPAAKQPSPPKQKPKKTVRISNTARLRVFRNPTTNNNSNTENENRNISVRNNQTRKYHKTKTRRVFNHPPNTKNKRLLAMYKKVKAFSSE